MIVALGAERQRRPKRQEDVFMDPRQQGEGTETGYTTGQSTKEVKTRLDVS